jgi:hypothetical protein
VDANLDDHPRHRAAGFWGSTLAQCVWRLAKRFGRHDGEITGFWDRDVLVDRLRCEANVPEVESGMDAAERAGLIERVDDKVFIHDFAQYQRVNAQQMKRERDAERQRRHRHASERDRRDINIESVTGVTVTENHAVTTNKTKLNEEEGRARAGDPTTTDSDTAPACLLLLATRHQELAGKNGATPYRWAKEYTDLLRADLPPGAPAVASSAWEDYAAQLRAALEHAFSDECRTWSDGSAYSTHVRSPRALYRCMDELLEDEADAEAEQLGPICSPPPNLPPIERPELPPFTPEQLAVLPWRAKPSTEGE